MERREDQRTSSSGFRESGAGAPRRWAAPILLLSLMAATAHMASRPAEPFAISPSHVVWLLGWALVTCVYVVLAGRDRRGPAGLGKEPVSRSEFGGAQPAVSSQEQFPPLQPRAHVSRRVSDGQPELSGGKG